VLEVERRQHGRPSGVDHRTILRGGVQWAERDEGGELRCQTLALAPGALAPLRVFHTGTPAESTGRMVEAVRERFAGESGRLEAILDRMGEKVVGLRRALTAGPDPERIRALVSAYQRDLEALGVVPEAVRRTVRAIEATGAAAKVSGAGGLRGPEAGSLLAYDPEGVLEGAECVAGLERFDAELGVEGLEIESLS
jgi:mevalonate kinase